MFVELMTGYATTNSFLGGQKVTISEDIFYLEGMKATSGTKPIINDVLVWSNNVEDVLLYFQCVCWVFQKYRVKFRLDKCIFLEQRVEFIDHNLTADGNCPAQSKFDLIRDWCSRLRTEPTFLCQFDHVLFRICAFFRNVN